MRGKGKADVVAIHQQREQTVHAPVSSTPDAIERTVLTRRTREYLRPEHTQCRGRGECPDQVAVVCEIAHSTFSRCTALAPGCQHVHPVPFRAVALTPEMQAANGLALGEILRYVTVSIKPSRRAAVM